MILKTDYWYILRSGRIAEFLTDNINCTKMLSKNQKVPLNTQKIYLVLKELQFQKLEVWDYARSHIEKFSAGIESVVPFRAGLVWVWVVYKLHVGAPRLGGQ